MICINCSRELPDVAVFCPYCGTRLAPVAAPQTDLAPPVIEAESDVANMAAPAVETQPQAAEPVVAQPVQEEAAEPVVAESVPEETAEPVVAEPVQEEVPAHSEAADPVELPAEEKAKPAKKKKSPVGVVLTVAAVVLIIALAGLNVFQYMKGEDVAAQLAGANDQILQMETEAGALKDEIAGLDAELTQLKGEYDALAGQADTANADIEDLETQIASLEEAAAGYEAQVAALEEENAGLADTAAKWDAYEAMLNDEVALFRSTPEANGYNAYDDFYGESDVIFVEVGQTVEYAVTYEDHDADNPDAQTVVAWQSWYVDCSSQEYDGDVLTVSITGLRTGTSILEFSNTTNDATFEVLVVITY